MPAERRTALGGAALLLGILAGCEQDMADQPKYKAFQAAAIFPHGQSALMPVEGTVPRESQTDVSPPITESLLARGRERYDIYCSPCHGRVGDGEGMIVQRGFPHPPSYHTDALRAAPDRQFYEVITRGYGVMYSYAARVSPEDRWAIIAYIRALQLSQHAGEQESRPEHGSHGESGHVQ